jgi:hypothetical protein
MLTAYEREKLIKQWDHDQLVAEWRRQRSEAYAGVIRRAYAALGSALTQLRVRIAGATVTRPAGKPQQGAPAV